MRLLIIFFALGYSSLSQAANQNECLKSNRELLSRSGYSASVLAKFCGDPVPIYSGTVSTTNRKEALEMVQKMKALGCKSVVLLNPSDSSDETTATVVSQNCRLVQLPDACPVEFSTDPSDDGPHRRDDAPRAEIIARTMYRVGTEVCLERALATHQQTPGSAAKATKR